MVNAELRSFPVVLMVYLILSGLNTGSVKILGQCVSILFLMFSSFIAVS